MHGGQFSYYFLSGSDACVGSLDPDEMQRGTIVLTVSHPPANCSANNSLVFELLVVDEMGTCLDSPDGYWSAYKNGDKFILHTECDVGCVQCSPSYETAVEGECVLNTTLVGFAPEDCSSHEEHPAGNTFEPIMIAMVRAECSKRVGVP
jgi:hypothetical protein